MALTPWRWLAALLAACLICSIGILNIEPTDRGRFNRPDPFEEARGAYGQQARDIAQHLRLVQVMDSVHAGSDKGVTTPVRVLVGASVPTTARGPIEALAKRALSAVGDSGRMGLDVYFVYDTGTVRGIAIGSYYGTLDYVLPANARDRCAVIFRFGANLRLPMWIAQTIGSEQASQQLLGPCAFYRAFGMPGPQIGSWLRTRGLTLATDGSWSEAEPLVDRSRASTIDSRLYFMPGMSFETPLWQMSVAAAHCVANEPGACGPVLFGGKSRISIWNGNVLHAPILLGRGNSYYWPGPLGMRETFLLRDMVRTIGQQRFEQFWTSNEAPDVAFTKASGQSVDAWTVKWAQDEYGPAPTSGPAISVWAACMGIALTIIAMGFGLRVASARQYS